MCWRIFIVLQHNNQNTEAEGSSSVLQMGGVLLIQWITVLSYNSLTSTSKCALRNVKPKIGKHAKLWYKLSYTVNVTYELYTSVHICADGTVIVHCIVKTAWDLIYLTRVAVTGSDRLDSAAACSPTLKTAEPGWRHVLGQVEITKMHCKHHAEGSLAYADVRGQVQKGEERGEGRPHIVGFVFWSHSMKNQVLQMCLGCTCWSCFDLALFWTFQIF